MTVEEIANYLNFSERTIYTMIKKNKIPYIKIGGQYRFKRETIDGWLQKKTEMKVKESEKS